MMDATTHNTVTRVVTVLLLAVLAGVLAFTTGCPKDDSAQMAQQMASGRQRTQASSQPDKPAGSSQEAPSGMVKMVGGGDESAGEQQAEGSGEEPAGEEAAEGGGYEGPKVIIDDLQVKAPYPEFAGEGRYDLSFTVELEESTPPGVWELRALNEEGEVVGSLEQFLSLSYGWEKPLDFKALYCSEMPTNVEMRLTDKQPEQASEEAAGTGSGAHSGGGGRGAMGMGGGAAEEEEEEE